MPVTDLPLGGSTDPGNVLGWTAVSQEPSTQALASLCHLVTSQDDLGFCPQITELETEKRDLERQVNEQKAKCEAIEKRETERRQVEEKKHNEEIQFLKRTNQQLKVVDAQAQVEVLPHARPQPGRPGTWVLSLQRTSRYRVHMHWSRGS